MPVVQSLQVKHPPSHVLTSVHRGESQQQFKRKKDSENLVLKSANDDKIAQAEVKHFPPDEKIAPRGGEGMQDADYDENMEVELDKEEVKFARRRAAETQYEVQRNVAITSSNLPRILAAHSAASRKHLHVDSDGIRAWFKYPWFFLVVAVFLLSFWLRCLRCIRCGFLLRRCRWLCSCID